MFVVSAMFYDGIGNEIGAEMAMIEANKLNVSEAKAVRDEQREQERLERERLREKEKLTKEVPVTIEEPPETIEEEMEIQGIKYKWS